MMRPWTYNYLVVLPIWLLIWLPVSYLLLDVLKISSTAHLTLAILGAILVSCVLNRRYETKYKKRHDAIHIIARRHWHLLKQDTSRTPLSFLVEDPYLCSKIEDHFVRHDEIVLDTGSNAGCVIHFEGSGTPPILVKWEAIPAYKALCEKFKSRNNQS